MRKWMDKGAAKAERGTPAPRGVNSSTRRPHSTMHNHHNWPVNHHVTLTTYWHLTETTTHDAQRWLTGPSTLHYNDIASVSTNNLQQADIEQWPWAKQGTVSVKPTYVVRSDKQNCCQRHSHSDVKTWTHSWQSVKSQLMFSSVSVDPATVRQQLQIIQVKRTQTKPQSFINIQTLSSIKRHRQITFTHTHTHTQEPEVIWQKTASPMFHRLVAWTYMSRLYNCTRQEVSYQTALCQLEPSLTYTPNLKCQVPTKDGSQ